MPQDGSCVGRKLDHVRIEYAGSDWKTVRVPRGLAAERSLP